MLEAFFLLSGRLGRLAYFGYSVAFAVVLAIVAAILLLPLRGSPNAGPVLVVVIVLLVVIGLWGSIALAVKRLHDLDKSGWHYAWIVMVPAVLNGLSSAFHVPEPAAIGGLISLVVWVYLVFWPGTPGSNRFGYQP